jgi:hypothetical protein
MKLEKEEWARFNKFLKMYFERKREAELEKFKRVLKEVME